MAVYSDHHLTKAALFGPSFMFMPTNLRPKTLGVNIYFDNGAEILNILTHIKQERSTEQKRVHRLESKLTRLNICPVCLCGFK